MRPPARVRIALRTRRDPHWGGTDMHGFQITFFTQQGRSHHGKPLADWLVRLASELGLRGATLIPASEGIGHHHRIHSAHFFELADQPLSVVMAVTSDEADRLFDRLRAEGLHLFYVKTTAEFGVVGEADGA
ncbi:PII-like signaling protein [Paraburkholderia sp. MM6662-R1]